MSALLEFASLIVFALLDSVPGVARAVADQPSCKGYATPSKCMSCSRMRRQSASPD